MVRTGGRGAKPEQVSPGSHGQHPVMLSRGVILMLAVLVILGLGLLIRALPGDWSLTTADKLLPDKARVVFEETEAKPVQPPLFDRQQWRLDQPLIDPDQNPAGHANTQLQAQIRVLFEHGANLLRQGSYRRARQALEMLVALAPGSPEAHVNLGFALFELDQIEPALAAFQTASQLSPYQSNAYYGAALAYERRQDYEAALGQMRSFIHLSQAGNRFLPRARAALWEWEARVVERRSQQGSAPASQ